MHKQRIENIFLGINTLIQICKAEGLSWNYGQEMRFVPDNDNCHIRDGEISITCKLRELFPTDYGTGTGRMHRATFEKITVALSDAGLPAPRQGKRDGVYHLKFPFEQSTCEKLDKAKLRALEHRARHAVSFHFSSVARALESDIRQHNLNPDQAAELSATYADCVSDGVTGLGTELTGRQNERITETLRRTSRPPERPKAALG